MNISVFAALCAAVLAAAGVLSEELEKARTTRWNAAFFMLSLAALSEHELAPCDGVFISPACALALSAGVRLLFPINRSTVLHIAAAMTAALITVPPAASGTSFGPYAVGLAAALPALLPKTGLRSAFFSCGAAPVLAYSLAFLLPAPLGGAPLLELTDACLTAQITAFAAFPVLSYAFSRTPVRGSSADRTKA